MGSLKRTPLYPLYGKYGAKTIEFGGWEMPVQFTSILAEHEAVRKRAGLFDISHMGEIRVSGPDALSLIQLLITNDASQMKIGQAIYSPMCYPDGGTVDDLLVYRLNAEEYLLIVNAANIEKDLEWIRRHFDGEGEIENLSDAMALLALQGPLAQSLLSRLTGEDLNEIRPFSFKQGVMLDGISVLLSRTGYTGEDGFEIFVSPEEALSLWETILEVGKEEGVLPCGLGARDTLRLEAKLPLYGQELSPEITPLEAGLNPWVKLEKPVDFIGKEALREQKENGLQRRLVGIEMIDRGIPRHGYPVFLGEEEVGVVTSGTHSPTLEKSIALILVKRGVAEIGQELAVEIRGKKLKAKVVKTPFYKRKPE
ncbi:MAG: glycine cleavage system aminomethyltransferase GcvT [Thermicanus sp.]|nr:glycine cleavage system aminomethyltransferase GcvT [Thermicanus sp.]